MMVTTISDTEDFGMTVSTKMVVGILSRQCRIVLLITWALVTSGAGAGLACGEVMRPPFGQQNRKGNKINILHGGGE